MMKIAIVHDYLNQLGGAERVVTTFHKMYPEAPIFTLLVDSHKLWPEMQDALIVASIAQRFKFIRNHFKLFFWLYPFVIRTIKVEGYDVVISSSSAFGKGVVIGSSNSDSRPIHICYCHTPMRFAWDFDRYIANETHSPVLKRVAKMLTPILRAWDKNTSRNVDCFVANSMTVQKRIKKTYDRDSVVIFPPVNVHRVEPQVADEYFLVVSRLVSYKRIDLAVQACSSANLPLVVIGDGPDRERLESLAGPTTRFLGFQPEGLKRSYMGRCKALILPGEEDFGITPIEVNSLGRPVIAYQAGGALDTITNGVNGLFFTEQTVESLQHALYKAIKYPWNSSEIISCARRFEESVFVSKFRELIETSLNTRSIQGNENSAPVKVTQGGESV